MLSPRLGVYFGFMSIMGYNLGTRKYGRIAKLIVYADLLTTVMLLIVELIIISLMPYLLMLFSDDSVFIAKATPWIRMSFSCMFSIGSITFCSGIYQMERKAVTATSF